jgi:hypothetical protein
MQFHGTLMSLMLLMRMLAYSFQCSVKAMVDFYGFGVKAAVLIF